MEPVEAKVKVRYLIPTTVTLVEERFRRVHLHGAGDAAQFREESLGWFVWLEGSYEMLGVGPEKPALAIGDRIRITIEKETNHV